MEQHRKRSPQQSGRNGREGSREDPFLGAWHGSGMELISTHCTVQREESSIAPGRAMAARGRVYLRHGESGWRISWHILWSSMYGLRITRGGSGVLLLVDGDDGDLKTTAAQDDAPCRRDDSLGSMFDRPPQ